MSWDNDNATHRKSEASNGPILIPANTPADICINFPDRTQVALIISMISISTSTIYRRMVQS